MCVFPYPLSLVCVCRFEDGEEGVEAAPRGINSETLRMVKELDIRGPEPEPGPEKMDIIFWYEGIHEKGSGDVVSTACYTIYTIYIFLCTQTAETTYPEPFSWIPLYQNQNMDKWI